MNVETVTNQFWLYTVHCFMYLRQACIKIQKYKS